MKKGLIAFPIACTWQPITYIVIKVPSWNSVTVYPNIVLLTGEIISWYTKPFRRYDQLNSGIWKGYKTSPVTNDASAFLLNSGKAYLYIIADYNMISL